MDELSLSLTVTMTDGTVHDVTPSTAAIIAAERHFAKPMVQLFSADAMAMDTLCFLAWNQLKREDKTPRKYDVWLETVAAIGMDTKEADTAPLDETT